MKKNILILLALFLISSSSILAQGAEIKMGIGTHFTKVKLKYGSLLDRKDMDNGFQQYNSHVLAVGGAIPFKKDKWYVNADMGFMNTTTFHWFSYSYTLLGTNNTSKRWEMSYLANQRLFFSLYPEYRIKMKSFFLGVNAGLFQSIDISNTYLNLNQNLLPREGPILGGKVGLKFLTKIKSIIGFEFTIDYIVTDYAVLRSDFHPKIGYHYLMGRFNLVYTL